MIRATVRAHLHRRQGLRAGEGWSLHLHGRYNMREMSVPARCGYFQLLPRRAHGNFASHCNPILTDAQRGHAPRMPRAALVTFHARQPCLSAQARQDAMPELRSMTSTGRRLDEERKKLHQATSREMHDEDTAVLQLPRLLGRVRRSPLRVASRAFSSCAARCSCRIATTSIHVWEVPRWTRSGFCLA